jgi:hypothetical protein
MLTANQLILLGVVVSAQLPPSTVELAAVGNEHGHEFGEDAARNCMSRLEVRGFVVGAGRGRAKTWAPTPAGSAAYQELLPAEAPASSPDEADQDSSQEKGPRTYVVLEECSLADAVREALPDDYAVPDTLYEALNGKAIYDIVLSPEARNTEHALRQTAKALYDADEHPTLVAVAGKMWRPVKPKVNNRQTVSF